jgi:hypothetical protein
VNITGGTVTRTFVIRNTGSGELHLLDNPAVTLSGATDHFEVTVQPELTISTGGSTTTFEIAFDPTIVGLHRATVRIVSDDSNEGSYEFIIQGEGIHPNSTIYDLDEDWIDGSNSFGTWTFYKMPNVTTPPWVADISPIRSEFTGPQGAFTDGGRPMLLKSNGNTVPSVDLPAGTVGILDGITTKYEAIVWTAPAAGEYSIDASFWNTGIENSFGLTIEHHRGNQVLRTLVDGFVVSGGTSVHHTFIDDSLTDPAILDSILMESGDTLWLNFGNAGPASPADIIGVDLRIVETSFPITDTEDFGDAPDSYGTLLASNGARHAVTSTLYVGSVIPDIDSDGFGDGVENNPNTATDDDSEGVDDEDLTILSFPSLSVDDTTYSITVSVSNTTGGDAKLIGWIDFDGDGVFQTDEAAMNTVQNGDTAQILTWNNIGSTGPNIVAGDTFVRIRLTTDASIDMTTPTGPALDGEVEDLSLTVLNSPVLDGTPGNDDFHVVLNGTDLEVRAGGSTGPLVLSTPLADISHLTINGLDGEWRFADIFKCLDRQHDFRFCQCQRRIN